jgi:hypothetical protein
MSEYFGASQCHRYQAHRRQRSPSLGKYLSPLFEMAIAVATFWFVAVASAAEITIGQLVVLEGPIEVGDYDKLRDFLIANRDYGIFGACDGPYLDGCPEEIYLASPGGDVAEAMKIGRLVRSLGWETMAPTRFLIDGKATAAGLSLQKAEIKRYELENPTANLMCASACFFIFVGGILRENGLFYGPPIIGVHRPYLPTERLKDFSGSEAIATANSTRAAVESYLKEMGVPTKYSDQMFSVSKDQILWISEEAFDADFRGFVPSLRDWVDAKCKLTDVEKVALESVNNKPFDKRTQAEQFVADQLSKKQWDCEQQAKFELRKDAWQRWRKETLKNIADVCAARKSSLPSELANALSAAKANQESGTVALGLAQTAALCRQYELRENAILVLAARGDAKAQRILGNLYYFGGSTIARDRAQGMAWYERAGAQGDLFAKKFHRDFADKLSDPNHAWTDEERMEGGRWVERNCPALC